MADEIKRWAILVGADATFGLGDVTRFKKWLMANRSMTDNNITCLTTKGAGNKSNTKECLPSKNNIINALQNRLDNSSEGELVFFYFLGHGTKEGSVMDSDKEFISPSELTDLFEKMAEKGLILTVVINSCYSGRIQRTDTKLYPHLGVAPKYNLLAACSPNQTTLGGEWYNQINQFDQRVSGGIGAYFTTYLLDALNENPQATLKMLHRRALASNSLNKLKTLPVLRERNKDNCAFFDTTKTGALRSIAAKWTGETTVEIDAGKAHGIREGSEYDVYSWDADKILPNQLKVTVTEVNALTSKAVTRGITRACQVVLAYPLIRDQDMDARWKEYYRMLNLKNYALDRADSYLPEIFSFGVYDEENSKTYDIYNRSVNTKLKLRFQMQKHPEYKFVRLTVLQFMTNGDIHKYYPWGMDFEVITPDSDCVFEIEKYMDDISIADDCEKTTVTFKAMITIAPTSFEAVLEARIRDNVTGNRSRVGEPRDDRINTLPGPVDAGDYGPPRNPDDGEDGKELNPPGRWRTMNVTIHTSK